MPQIRILLSGDSSTYGYGDPQGGGWGAYLKPHMMERSNAGERPSREVVNLAASSQSVVQIAERLPGYLAGHTQESGSAIFMVGGVDSSIWWRTNDVRVQPSRYMEAFGLANVRIYGHFQIVRLRLIPEPRAALAMSRPIENEGPSSVKRHGNLPAS